MRLIAALLLSLVMAVTSVTMAVARGQEPSGGMVMVLCTSEGTETVAVDPAGNPVPAHHHHCPDCLPGFLALAEPASLPSAPHPASRATEVAHPAPFLLPGQAPHVLRARGPPLSFV